MSEVGASSNVPARLLAELPAEEIVLRSAPARLGPSPGARESLRGSAVLTTGRLSFVPGDVPVERPNDPIRILAGELWQLVRPALLDAFPIVQLIAARQAAAPLAGRGRPGIEVPLQMLDSAFVAGAVPGWLGLRIPLGPSDDRPPFTLYLDLGPGTASEWQGLLEGARATARPRPELERPYALYYLFRPLPTPWVYVRRGPSRDAKMTEVGRGKLTLGADGPTLTKTPRVALLPYEAVERVEVAHAGPWRHGWVDLVTAEGLYDFLAPRSDRRALEDLGLLVSELSGAPATIHPGPVAGGRVAFRAAWLTAAGAGLAELAHLIFF